MKENEIPVHGVNVDEQTRCRHYHAKNDIIAIKFKCCHQYYSCYLCHQQCADHEIQRWPAASFSEKAILCGQCGDELTIEQYMSGGFQCPHCQAAFNPGCRFHYHLYFERAIFS